MPLRLTMTTFALIAALAGPTALAGDIAPPPSPTQGGDALEFVETLADQPGGGDGEHVTVGKDQAGLIVRGREAGETTTLVIELKSPNIAATKYIVKGWVKCEGVVGEGYMEMLSRFDGEEAFTRTLGERGPMGKLKGDSNWRIFVLPFLPSPGKSPEHVAVNVVLPSKGTVTLTDVRLVQFNDAPTTAPAASAFERVEEIDHGGGKPAQAPIPVPRNNAPTESLLTTPFIVFWSIGVIALFSGMIATRVLMRRRRHRQETITNELRRMHALDAI